MKNMDINVGDKFKGKINNEIFTITKIDKDHDVIFYENKGKEFYYGLGVFKKCLLERLN